MITPFSWLKEYVDIDITPQELQEKLFSCGFEVEELYEVGKDISKVVVGKVNVDEERELAIRYGVMSIPTVIFFKDGKEIDRKVGVMPPAAFTEVLDKNL